MSAAQPEVEQVPLTFTECVADLGRFRERLALGVLAADQPLQPKAPHHKCQTPAAASRLPMLAAAADKRPAELAAPPPLTVRLADRWFRGAPPRACATALSTTTSTSTSTSSGRQSPRTSRSCSPPSRQSARPTRGHTEPAHNGTVYLRCQRI